MDITNPTQARKDFYNLIDRVNETHEPVYITGKKGKQGAVMISEKDWGSIQETLYLQNAGIAEVIKERENDELIDVEDINWDTL